MSEYGGVAITTLVEELKRRGPDYVGPLTGRNYDTELLSGGFGIDGIVNVLQEAVGILTGQEYAIRAARLDLLAADAPLDRVLVFGRRDLMEFVDTYQLVSMVLPGMVLFWPLAAGEGDTLLVPSTFKAAPPEKVHERRVDAVGQRRYEELLRSERVLLLTAAEMDNHGRDVATLMRRAHERLTAAQAASETRKLDSVADLVLWMLLDLYDRNDVGSSIQRRVQISMAAAVCAGVAAS